MRLALRASIASLVAAGFLTVPVLARAQGTPQPRAGVPAAPAAPDVVRLNDGTVFRGTISELVPGSHVDIVLVSGTTRRVPMKEVMYAGPADSQPPIVADNQSAPMVTLNARPVRLQLWSDTPGIEFHRKTGTSSAMVRGRDSAMIASSDYELICAAPCSVTMPSGTHRFGITKDGDDVPTESVYIPSDGRVNADYSSFKALRIAGVLVTLGGLASGIYFAATAVHPSCDDGEDCEQIEADRMLLGVGLIIGGAVIGGLMSSKQDEVELTFSPLAPGGVPGPGARGQSWYLADTGGAPAGSNLLGGAAVPGLSLQARF